MNIKEEIIESTNIIVDEAIKGLVGCDIPATIEKKQGNKYQVTIKGVTKFIKDGVGISPSVGDAVWVRLPNGLIKDAYIEARR